jgi:UDP-N-acetylmuramyl pentapeptide phosphotransferase/UDP-N-acetylglucosamine-1-phosphate transferase
VILAVGLVLGLVVGRALLALLAPALAAPTFTRTNYRGASLPTAAGLVLAATALVVEACLALLDAARLADLTTSGGVRALTVATVVGFALLGVVDDLAGTGLDGRGFRGHLRALAHGRLTTGGLKLGGGAALAVAVCAPLGGRLGPLLVDAALVALAANLGNLFDRAPGRTTKVAALAAAALVLAVGPEEQLVGVAVVVGAALALLGADLGERLMLGDTGANALGAALGLGVVVTAPLSGRAAVVLALVALNLASEVVSFSRVIDRVAPLRALDRLGRRPAPPA